MKNRELKFRAFDKKRKHMLIPLMGFVIDPNKKRFRYYRLDDSQNDGIGTNVMDLKDVDIMQYTGLSDKNGKEIYEGDVCQTGMNLRGVVTYHEERCAFIFNDVKNYNSLLFEYLNDLRIIGNIHQDKDLLK